MSIRRLVLPAARAMARWHALRTVDVPALNATLKAAGGCRRSRRGARLKARQGRRASGVHR
ncbi:MAG: hypothetical protein IMZ55_08290 [Acidobacteria bacterium]|nr:hypothetical protein [Acidobacteriota bacterium]